MGVERARDDGLELVIAESLHLAAAGVHHAIEAEVEVGVVEEEELVKEPAEFVERAGCHRKGADHSSAGATD